MKTRNKKALAVAAVAPTLLVLSACRVDTVVEINDDGTATIVMEVEDTDGEMSGFGYTCDQLFSDMGMSDPLDTASEESVTIEDISGENLACRMTVESEENVVDGETLIDNGDTFTFVAEPDPTFTMDEMPEGFDLNFTMTIQMPGDIIEATNDAEVSGNRATYSDIDIMVRGFEVTGNKGGGGGGQTGGQGTGGGTGEGTGGGEGTEPGGETIDPNEGLPRPGSEQGPGGDGSSVGSDAENEASADEDSGFPMWAWFAIGGGALVIIGLVTWMIMRGNKNKNQGPYGPGGGYGPHGGQPGPTGAYGVPQSGQHSAPGGQFQAPQDGQYGQTQQYPGQGSQQPPHNPNHGGQQPPHNPNQGGQGQWG